MSGVSLATPAHRPRWVPALAVGIALLLGLLALRMSHDRPSVRDTAPVPQRVALVEAPAPLPPRELVREEPVEETESALADDSTGPAEPGPPALDEAIGVEGEGQAGFDAFGLRAKRGGRDITLDFSRGGRPGFNSVAIVGFASRLADSLESELRQVPELRGREYSVQMRVWVDGEGRVARCDVLGSAGAAKVDAALRDVMSRSSTCVGPPPADFPNPVTLVVRSRAGQR